MTADWLRQVSLPLSTGVTANVALAGPEHAPPAILLHGFPESHRTWLAVAERLKDSVRLIMPDLRGFGASDRPQEVEAYATDTLIADIFAVAGGLGIEQFALVGHDWGGAIAWAATIREAALDAAHRITRLGIVNSPHPLIFQESLIEDQAQRAASQYIRAFRDPGMEAAIAAMGMPAFFDKSFARHVDMARLPGGERERYLADWSRPGAMTAMLNWYRASQIVVPEPGEEVDPPLWTRLGLPIIRVPVRVVWGLDDKALLPVQLEGIGEVGEDVEVFPLPGVGHFAPWQAPDEVAQALRPFLETR